MYVDAPPQPVTTSITAKASTGSGPPNPENALTRVVYSGSPVAVFQWPPMSRALTINPMPPEVYALVLMSPRLPEYERPQSAAIRSATRCVNSAKEAGLPAPWVTSSAAGGAAIMFFDPRRSKDRPWRFATFECDNEGGVSAMTSDRESDDDPNSWDIEGELGMRAAIAEFARFLGL